VCGELFAELCAARFAARCYAQKIRRELTAGTSPKCGPVGVLLVSYSYRKAQKNIKAINGEKPQTRMKSALFKSRETA
jgi:pheromone shutdown protein TraB